MFPDYLVRSVKSEYTISAFIANRIGYAMCACGGRLCIEPGARSLFNRSLAGSADVGRRIYYLCGVRLYYSHALMRLSPNIYLVAVKKKSAGTRLRGIKTISDTKRTNCSAS
jgi:hypothetical protein